MDSNLDHTKIRDFPNNQTLAKSNNINFKIYVPSTRNKSIVVQPKTFEKRIDEVIDFVTRKFYGSSISRGVGTYTDHDNIIRENVACVSVFTTKEMYNANDLELKKFVLKKRNSWGQASIGYEYQNHLVFVENKKGLFEE